MNESLERRGGHVGYAVAEKYGGKLENKIYDDVNKETVRRYRISLSM